KQTLHRLKDTELDLSRVEDLLLEIEKNLKSLEHQAKKTERYYRIKNQYKESSISLAASRISGYRENLGQIKKKVENQQKHQGRLVTEIEMLEASPQQLKGNLIIEEKNLTTQQKALNAEKAKIQNYETEKKI